MTIATIDVRDLVGKPGASRELPVSGTLEGLASELASIPHDAPIRGELLLESVVEGILVSGTIEGTMTLRCARCLTEFDQPFRVQVHELFTERPDEESDEYLLDADHGIDPDQMFRDAIGVELPFSPLCRPDCQGLCEVCGGNRNLGECPGHASIDPRFAVLSDLLPELGALEASDPDDPTTDPHGRN
ncbi:MAG TPA: YceD family protein [Actinomycetota bacterium]|nr:YceD family protein [Actinomycetota bacterium]